MDRRSLAAIDYSKYMRLLESGVAEVESFLVYTSDGFTVWSSNNSDTSIHLFPGGKFSSVHDRKITFHKLSETEILYQAGIVTENDCHIANVSALLSYRNQDGVTGYIPGTVKLMDDVALCIKTELMLNKELDEMAEELGERYEELNLVYHVKEETAGFEDINKTLSSLVKQCLSYLDVEIVVLFLPERNVVITLGNKDSAMCSGTILLPELRNRVLRHVKETGKSIVVNHQSEAEGLIAGMRDKLLCSPVFTGYGAVTGVLLTISMCGKREFTNSDRSLLEVMASKVTKLLNRTYDSLTGLHTRKSYEYYVGKSIESAQMSGMEHCVLHLNLDQLKIVNENAGHEAGDALIRMAGDTIHKYVRGLDIVARIGGDEFGVLLESCPIERAERLAEDIRQAIGKSPFEWESSVFDISVSIGVACIDAGTRLVSEALNAAEVACMAAKDIGKNQVKAFSSTNTDMLARKDEMHWVGRIREALIDDRFELFGQAIKDLQQHSDAVHVEILVRMRLEDGEVVAPGNFIPAAERYNLMPKIDRWVVTNLFRILAENGNRIPHGSVFAVNLSGQSISSKSFLEFLVNIIDRSEMDASQICFEVTETAAVSHIDDAKEFISTIRERGCSFALDDFGSGLSSFVYLKNLDVDYLKIDGMLVKGIVTDPISEAMVSSINHVGTVMGIKTVAEYVENAEIEARLVALGISYGQGYAYGFPVPLIQHFECEPDTSSIHSVHNGQRQQ
ncbi:MAG: EAL domain-containing protein [Gammaproteobacteria bacterium]|nr:EAL domain-containing protein [Gammaproteobacteria bacterium]